MIIYKKMVNCCLIKHCYIISESSSAAIRLCMAHVGRNNIPITYYARYLLLASQHSGPRMF